MMENSEEVLLELIRFGAAGERIGGEISPVLESYLQYVARSGDTVFSWQRLMPLFKCKLDRAIDQFVRDTPVDKVPAMPNVEPFQFSEMRSEMHQAIDSVGGTPFTIQRLCELVTDPYRYYKRVDKYMRGVEKNIRVVSVIDHHKRSRDVVNGDYDMDEHAAVTTSRHSNGSLALDQCSTDGVTSSMSPSDDVNGSSRQSPSPELPGVDSMLCAMSEHNSDVFAEANSSSNSNNSSNNNSNNNSGNIIDNAVVSDTTPALPGTLSTTANSNNISSGGSGGGGVAAEDCDSGVCSSLTVGAAVQAVNCGPAAEAASQSDAMETCDDEALPIASATVADSPVSSDAPGSGCGTTACDATAGALTASAAAAAVATTAVSSSQLVSPSASSPPPVSAATAGGGGAANAVIAGAAAGGGGAATAAGAAAVAATADGSDTTTAGIVDTTCSVRVAASAAPSDASGAKQSSAAPQSGCLVSTISVTADASSVSTDSDTLTAAPTVPAASDMSEVVMDTECLPVDSSFDQSSTIKDSKSAPAANCGESAVHTSVDCPAGVPTASLPAAHTSSAASSSGGGGGDDGSDCDDTGCAAAASCCDAAAEDANLSCSSDMSLEHSLCDDSGAAGVATEATGSTGGEPGDQSSCQIQPAALVVAAAQSHEVSDNIVSAAATAAAAADGVAATDAGAVTADGVAATDAGAVAATDAGAVAAADASDITTAAADASDITTAADVGASDITTTAADASDITTAAVAAAADVGAAAAADASDITTAAAAAASGGAAGSAQSHTTDQLATTAADSSCDRRQSVDRAS